MAIANKEILPKYKTRLLLRCIYHFKSDLINYMDHVRISGTEWGCVGYKTNRNIIKLWQSMKGCIRLPNLNWNSKGYYMYIENEIIIFVCYEDNNIFFNIF